MEDNFLIDGYYDNTTREELDSLHKNKEVMFVFYIYSNKKDNVNKEMNGRKILSKKVTVVKITIKLGMYKLLRKIGINFNDFRKGEELFRTDRDEFMKVIEKLGGRVELIEKDRK